MDVLARHDVEVRLFVGSTDCLERIRPTSVLNDHGEIGKVGRHPIGVLRSAIVHVGAEQAAHGSRHNQTKTLGFVEEGIERSVIKATAELGGRGVDGDATHPYRREFTESGDR